MCDEGYMDDHKIRNRLKIQQKTEVLSENTNSFSSHYHIRGNFLSNPHCYVQCPARLNFLPRQFPIFLSSPE